MKLLRRLLSKPLFSRPLPITLGEGKEGADRLQKALENIVQREQKALNHRQDRYSAILARNQNRRRGVSTIFTAGE